VYAAVPKFSKPGLLFFFFSATLSVFFLQKWLRSFSRRALPSISLDDLFSPSAPHNSFCTMRRHGATLVLSFFFSHLRRLCTNKGDPPLFFFRSSRALAPPFSPRERLTSDNCGTSCCLPHRKSAFLEVWIVAPSPFPPLVMSESLLLSAAH